MVQKDEAIHLKYSKHFIKAFPSSQVTVKTIKDSGHKSIIEKEQYFFLLKEFIKFK